MKRLVFFFPISFIMKEMNDGLSGKTNELFFSLSFFFQFLNFSFFFVCLIPLLC